MYPSFGTIGRMLTIYRRHLTSGFGPKNDKPCPHLSKGRQYRRCSCPIWVQGTVAGDPVRKSLDLTNWERATEVVRDMEVAGTVETPEDDRITVTDAILKFTTDATARNLAASTLEEVPGPAGSSRRNEAGSVPDPYRILH